MEEKIKQEKVEKIRKMFLDELPRWETLKNKGSIRWEKCVGYKVHFIYEDIKGWINIVNYDKNTRRIKIIYGDNEDIMLVNHFINCKIGKILKKHTSEFKYKIGQRIKDDKRDITITAQKYTKEKGKRYKYHCNICEFDCNEYYDTKQKEYKKELWMSEYSLLDNRGCECCCNHILAEGINSIIDTNPEMIPYFQGGYNEAKLYTYGSSQKIIPICPDCGRVKDKSMTIREIYKTNSIGCSCNDKIPYPQKFMLNVLEQLDISFETEKKFDWCKYNDFKSNKLKQGYYDFYFELNDEKCIIETDGGFHNKDNDMSGQTAKESKYIDNEKDRLAEEHNIDVIRIDCNLSDLEYIKQNIIKDNKLNKLFDLSKINWIKVGEFACSNLVKVACSYKNDDTDMTTQDIGNIMGFHRNTITKWLKQGNELNWCEYCPIEELRKSSSKNGKLGRKLVIVLKDEIALGVFESKLELERQSKNLFGTKLLSSNMSSVCSGKLKTYKGFSFKLVLDITEEEYIKYDIENKLKQLNILV